MTNKCWKKSQTNNGFYKKSDGVYERIRFSKKPEFKGKPYVVVVENKKENTVLETEFFKTRNASKIFANKYMKKHDKC